MTPAVFERWMRGGAILYLPARLKQSRGLPRAAEGDRRGSVSQGHLETLCTRWLYEVAGVRLPPMTAVGGGGGEARENAAVATAGVLGGGERGGGRVCVGGSLRS